MCVCVRVINAMWGAQREAGREGGSSSESDPGRQAGRKRATRIRAAEENDVQL